jgi:hypothetical protein
LVSAQMTCPVTEPVIELEGELVAAAGALASCAKPAQVHRATQAAKRARRDETGKFAAERAEFMPPLEHTAA